MFLKVNSFIGGANWGLAFGFPFDDDARVDFKVCYSQFSHFLWRFISGNSFF
jgi:hypothetical protein